MAFGLSLLRRAVRPHGRPCLPDAPPPGPQEAARMLWLLRGGADTATIAASTGRSEAQVYNAAALAREEARADKPWDGRP